MTTTSKQRDPHAHPSTPKEWHEYQMNWHPFKWTDWRMLAQVTERLFKAYGKRLPNGSLRAINTYNLTGANLSEPFGLRVTDYKPEHWQSITRTLEKDWSILCDRHRNVITVVVSDGCSLYIGEAKRNPTDEFCYNTGYFLALKRAFLARPIELPVGLFMKREERGEKIPPLTKAATADIER